MSVATELQRIIDSKAAIKTAIENKGVLVGNGAIDTYAGKIDLIDEWVAPSDWIDIGTPANNEIRLLLSDINPYYSFVIVGGNYTIDWGDGSIISYNTTSEINHEYTIGTGQPCSRGYTTFSVRIYSSTPITKFLIGNPKTLRNGDVENGILMAKFGTINLTSLANTFYNSINYSVNLESVELPYTLSDCTNYTLCFYGAISLQNVVMPYIWSSSNINFSYVFYNCIKIRKIDLHISGSISFSSMTSTFNGCNSLISVSLPSTVNSCASWVSTFASCYKLKEITIPSINTVATCNGMFSNCVELTSIEFNSTWDGKIIDLGYLVTVCRKLKTLILPTSVHSSFAFNGLYQTFNNCQSIEIITLPIIPSNQLTNNGLIFYGCTLLNEVNNFPSCNTANTMNQIFSGCNSLKNISNIDNLGDTTTAFDHTLTFAGMYSVESLSIRNKITGRFVLTGVSTSNLNAALNSLIFTNPAAVSTWAGASPQIDVSYCSLSETALNTLFTSIIATSASFSGKVIRITGNPGAGTCNTSIITNAGGTVNKTT